MMVPTMMIRLPSMSTAKRMPLPTWKVRVHVRGRSRETCEEEEADAAWNVHGEGPDEASPWRRLRASDPGAIIKVASRYIHGMAARPHLGDVEGERSGEGVVIRGGDREEDLTRRAG